MATVLTGVLIPPGGRAAKKEETTKPKGHQAGGPQAAARPKAAAIPQPQEEAAMARIFGPGGWADPIDQPHPLLPPVNSPTETKPPVNKTEQGFPRFALTLLNAIVGPPLLLYGMVLFVGMSVLPTYFNYFENPQQSPSKT